MPMLLLMFAMMADYCLLMLMLIRCCYAAATSLRYYFLRCRYLPLISC